MPKVKALINLDDGHPLKDDLKQVWRQNSSARTWSDQFGFVIEYGTRYTLRYRETVIHPLYSKQAAELIARIMLNDIVMNKK